MFRRALPIAVAVAGILLLSSTAHASSILINGSFETPDVAPGTFGVFGGIPGWTLTSGSGIEIQDNVAGSPFHGDQFVELDSFDNSGMSQSVATTAGTVYTFTFAYSARPGRSALDNGIDVFFNGGLLQSLTADGVGLSDTSWTLYTFQVLATSAVSSVGFQATGPSNSFGGYVDAASLTAVPEPSALILLGTGLVGLVVRRRMTQRG